MRLACCFPFLLLFVGCPLKAPFDAGVRDSGQAKIDGGCTTVHASLVSVVDLQLSPSWVWTQGRGAGIGLVDSSRRPPSYLFVSTHGSLARAEPFATTLDAVAIVDGSGSKCGGAISSSGIVRLALEYSDGGSLRLDAGGNCQAFSGEWWATTVQFRPVRGHQTSPAEFVSDPDASVPPFLTPFDIDVLGSVLVDVDGSGVPFGMILPSRQEIRGHVGRAAYVYRFGALGVVFGTTLDENGHVRVAKWIDGGLHLLPSPDATGDVVLNSVGSDNRVCATLLGSGAPRVVLWDPAGQFVDFFEFDAGIAACNQLLDDGWIAVSLAGDAGQLSPALIQVAWSCGTE